MVTSISQTESAVHFFVNAILVFLFFPKYFNFTIVSNDVHYGFGLNLDEPCSASGQKSLVDNDINDIIAWCCLFCKLIDTQLLKKSDFLLKIIKTLPCIPS